MADVDDVEMMDAPIESQPFYPDDHYHDDDWMDMHGSEGVEWVEDGGPDEEWPHRDDGEEGGYEDLEESERFHALVPMVSGAPPASSAPKKEKDQGGRTLEDVERATRSNYELIRHPERNYDAVEVAQAKGLNSDHTLWSRKTEKIQIGACEFVDVELIDRGGGSVQSIRATTHRMKDDEIHPTVREYFIAQGLGDDPRKFPQTIVDEYRREIHKRAFRLSTDFPCNHRTATLQPWITHCLAFTLAIRAEENRMMEGSREWLEAIHGWLFPAERDASIFEPPPMSKWRELPRPPPVYSSLRYESNRLLGWQLGLDDILKHAEVDRSEDTMRLIAWLAGKTMLAKLLLFPIKAMQTVGCRPAGGSTTRDPYIGDSTLYDAALRGFRLVTQPGVGRFGPGQAAGVDTPPIPMPLGHDLLALLWDYLHYDATRPTEDEQLPQEVGFGIPGQKRRVFGGEYFAVKLNAFDHQRALKQWHRTNDLLCASRLSDAEAATHSAFGDAMRGHLAIVCGSHDIRPIVGEWELTGD